MYRVIKSLLIITLAAGLYHCLTLIGSDLIYNRYHFNLQRFSYTCLLLICISLNVVTINISFKTKKQEELLDDFMAKEYSPQIKRVRNRVIVTILFNSILLITTAMVNISLYYMLFINKPESHTMSSLFYYVFAYSLAVLILSIISILLDVIILKKSIKDLK